MSRYLTLAMTETNPNTDEYKVIAYSLDELNLCSLKIREKDFYDYKSNPAWDIGAITRVEKVTLETDKNGNKSYIPVNVSGIESYYDKEELKELLDEEAMNLSVLNRNNRIDYAVVKVNTLLSIEKPVVDGKALKSRISFISKGVKPTPCPILNKDYRWVKYWKHIVDTNRVDEKLEQYTKYFKESDKEIYLIIYKHNYDANYNRWIAGFHHL